MNWGYTGVVLAFILLELNLYFAGVELAIPTLFDILFLLLHYPVFAFAQAKVYKRSCLCVVVVCPL